MLSNSQPMHALTDALSDLRYALRNDAWKLEQSIFHGRGGGF